MADYRGPASNDRAAALAAVALVHVGLAALILAGLNVRAVSHVVERLKTFDIDEIVPPPPPPPVQRADRAKDEEGAAGKKAEPSPVVVPKPRIELPTKPPIPAAPVPGTGSAASAGAAQSGSGTGAGGSGTGRGGGGSGDFSGYTPARLIQSLTNKDYRSLTVGRLRRGSAVLDVQLNSRGMTESCRILRSSGDPVIDQGLCPLAAYRLRFVPARDNRGQAIPFRTQYVARWTN